MLGRTIGRLLTAVLAAGVLAGCAAPAPAPAPTSPAGAGAYAHLAELQRITDAAGGTRSTPSPGYDAAVDHVAAVLRAAGWDVATPTYQVEGEPGSGYRNVVAQTRTGDPAHVVMAGAHLDSVPEGPGINDNGSGVASLLQIAEQMGGSPGSPGDGPPGVLGIRGGRPRRLHRLRRRARPGRPRGDRALRQPRHGRLAQRRLLRPGRHRPTATRPVPPARRPWRRCSPTNSPGSAPSPTATASTASPTTTRSSPPASRPAGVLAGDEDDKTDAQAKAWGGRAGEEFDPCYHAGLRPPRRRRSHRARPVHRRGRRDRAPLRHVDDPSLRPPE